MLKFVSWNYFFRMQMIIIACARIPVVEDNRVRMLDWIEKLIAITEWNSQKSLFLENKNCS